MTTKTTIDWTAAGRAAAEATRTQVSAGEPVDLTTARDIMEHHLFFGNAETKAALLDMESMDRRAALDAAFAGYLTAMRAWAPAPQNAAALSAALRAHSKLATTRSIKLVCDMLADMPEDLACAYAERVRELDTTVAREVADMLDAYRAAMIADALEAQRARDAAALPPEDERCNDESGCDERATRILLRVNESTDLIYCAEHAPEGALPLHTKE